MASTLKRVLIGRPLASDEADHQRISKTIGLAVFSSDAISSTAYATGEILIVLVGAAGMIRANGQPTTDLLKPIAVLVVILLALVANSYRETIHAYPDGGGAYVVARQSDGSVTEERIEPRRLGEHDERVWLRGSACHIRPRRRARPRRRSGRTPTWVVSRQSDRPAIPS